MFASKSSDIVVVMPEGVDSVNPAKYRAFLGVKEDQGEKVATASMDIPAQPPQGSAPTKATYVPATNATAKGDTNADCDPTCLCEAQGMMNNSLEHLEDGYFACFHETIKATREVLADINEVDATYIDTVLEAMRTWHMTVTLALKDMQMDDCVVWDAKCKAINEATLKFGQVCEASHIEHANACEDRHKAVVEGDAKDPIVELLHCVLGRTRQVANIAVAAFQKHFEEALLPRVPVQHLPILVSNAYNTVSQFCMTVWRMVADECIMPMQHNYLMSSV